MNPRTFCREETFETALLLTYSFDPLFFERIVLRDLWAGGTNECLVIADRESLDEGIQRAMGQVQCLGRRYRLSTLSGIGRQHAKLFIRAGKSGALMWVGSGNITSGGWGENKELFTAWRVEPSDQESVTLYLDLVSSVVPLLHDSVRGVGQKLLDLEWLAGTRSKAPKESQVLLSQEGMSLAHQLEQRWQGRKFQTVRLLTGSTDKSGAFLRWLSETFGVEAATIGVDPDSCDFDPNSLSKLPLEVNIVPLPATPRPHAKFYFFEAKRDSAAVMGSANCSAAAWLVPPNARGNTELVIAYDQCVHEELEAVLSRIIHEDGRIPHEVLQGPRAEIETQDESKADRIVYVREFGASLISGEMSLVIEPLDGRIVQVEANFGNLRTPLHPHKQNNHEFLGKYPDLPVMRGTHFARLTFKFDDGNTFETLRWLDEHDELSQSSVRRRILSIDRLGDTTRRNEHQQILRDIGEVAKDIFRHEEFPDPILAIDRSTEASINSSVPVDPHDLVRSLDEAPSRHGDLRLSNSAGTLPIHGIMRILFKSAQSIEEQVEEGPNLEWTEADDVAPDGTDDSEQPNQGNGPSERLIKCLRTTMESFLNKQTESSFLLGCTATQFVQSAAFPLAVAARGLKGGWVDSTTALSWSIRVTDLLFHKQLLADDKSSHTGALALLKHRYAAEGRSATLETVLGNGLLWTALVADLTQLDWSETDRLFARELYLANLFSSPDLCSKASVETISQAVSSYRGNAKAEALLSEAEVCAAHVKELTNLLNENFVRLCGQQIGSKHEVGDLVYRPQTGFGWSEGVVTITSKAKIQIYLRQYGEARGFLSGMYCNVRLAAQLSSEIAGLVERLRRG